jgi:enoyl-CoA hydratase/carnithine racemase
MGRAKQLILSGELIDARMAQTIGMVDDVVADAELMAHVRGVAQRYLRSPWTAVLLSKQLTNRAFDLPFDAFLQEYAAAQNEAMQSEDHVAALQAYREEQERKRQHET